MPDRDRVKRRILKVIVSRGGAVVWSGDVFAEDATIGRAPTADIVLDDPSVSWTHARVSIGKGGIVFTDSSTNGSFRNDERIGTANLGPGGLVSIPPFELDMSIESVVESPGDRAVGTAIRRDPPPQLASTIPDTDVPPKRLEEPDAAAPPARRAQLRFVRGPQSLIGLVFPLSARMNRIGRSPDCDVCIDVAGVSRHHATLTPIDADRWQLCDTGSRNQVDVNGRVVHEATVQIGDEVGIGPEIGAVLTLAEHLEVTAPPVAPGTVYQTSNETLVVTRAPSPVDPRIEVVSVVGRVDGYSAAELKAVLGHVIDEGRRRIVIDLSRCAYCDHAGLAAIVNVQVAVAARKGALRLAGLSPQLRDAVFLLRLDDVLSLAPDAKTAAAELSEMH